MDHTEVPDQSEWIMGSSIAPRPTPTVPEDAPPKKSKKGKKKREAPKDVSLRSELLLPGWPKYISDSTVPKRSLPGRGAWLCRQLVSNTYHHRHFTKRIRANWEHLTVDERFACVGTVWSKAVSVLQYQGTGFGSSAKAERIARRMFGCYPPGYSFGGKVPKNGFDRYCQFDLCPYCHARRVVKMLADLERAFNKRPEGSKIWISPFYQVSTLPVFRRKMQLVRNRPAAAVAFYHPTPTTAVDKSWLIRGVMMTDEPGKVKDRKYKRRIYNSNQIAIALSRWMGYPAGWAAGGIVPSLRAMTWAFANLPDNICRYAMFGACREDCVPGSSMFDFAGNLHGASKPGYPASTRPESRRVE